METSEKLRRIKRVLKHYDSNTDPLDRAAYRLRLDQARELMNERDEMLLEVIAGIVAS